MKFSMTDKTLFQNDGTVIKKLSCHAKAKLEQLERDARTDHWRCDLCAREVLDTAFMTENEIVEQVSSNPETCLLVRRMQHNIEII